MSFLNDVKKPFNLVTFSITIISIGLSIFFYLDGKKEKEISYYVNESISKIYDSKNSSSAIKLIEQDSLIISKDVYVLTGTIWNSGELPITNEDLREKLSINLNNIERIIDYKIVKQYDPKVAQFSLHKNDSKQLGINWKYFDRDFAFNFQILFVSDEVPNFKLEGKILGVKKFNKVTPNEKLSVWFSVLTSLNILLMGLLFHQELKKSKINPWLIKWVLYPIIILLWSVGFMYILYSRFLASNVIPL